MSESKVVRVEIHFEDGRRISLLGKDAEAWNQRVVSDSLFAANHGIQCPEFPWTETRVDTKRCARCNQLRPDCQCKDFGVF